MSLVVKIYLNCPFPFNLKQRKEKEAQDHIISHNSPYGAAGGSAQFLFLSSKRESKRKQEKAGESKRKQEKAGESIRKQEKAGESRRKH